MEEVKVDVRTAFKEIKQLRKELKKLMRRRKYSEWVTFSIDENYDTSFLSVEHGHSKLASIYDRHNCYLCKKESGDYPFRIMGSEYVCDSCVSIVRDIAPGLQ